MEQVSAQELERWAAAARERWNVPGMAVGAFSGGKVVTAEDGVRQRGRDEPVAPETVFRIASIRKPIVATTAMTLVQDGLLALDEPVPGSRVEATVRQLLSHQGGLACEWPDRVDRLGDVDEALIRVLEGEPERLPVGPGELFSYCNVGYWLVGAAIVRAAGTGFQEAVRARVLEPLGMGSTGFDPPEGAARGHEQVEPGSDEHRVVDEAIYPAVRRPSAGLWSSVRDLLRFAEHHLGGPGPLTDESRAEMHAVQIAAGSEGYGLGWHLYETGGRRVVEHLGSAAGFHTLLVLAPSEALAVVGLTNSSRGLAALREVLQPLGLARDERSVVSLSPDELGAFAGRFRGQGFELELAPADGGLRVAFTEVDPFSGETSIYPTVHARPIGPREFEILDGEWRGDRFDFPRDGLVSMGTLAARIG